MPMIIAPPTPSQNPARSIGVILPDLDEADEHPMEIGWKVYPFPPVFWRRITVQALAPELRYYGPLSQGRSFIRQIMGNYPSPVYVYVIQDDEGDVLYVGKTINPENRLTAHRKTKDWWPAAGSLTLLAIEAESRSLADAVGFKVESIAIRDLNPRYNIAGVRH